MSLSSSLNNTGVGRIAVLTLFMRTSRSQAICDYLTYYTSPWVAGISGSPGGAYSVALSGGYEDDVDMGECL
jgi:hypothetical protein